MIPAALWFAGCALGIVLALVVYAWLTRDEAEWTPPPAEEIPQELWDRAQSDRRARERALWRAPADVAPSSLADT